MAVFTAGQKLRASELNDALDTPIVKVVRETDYAVSDGNTSDFIPWEAATVDSDGMFNPADPTRVVIQTPGVWLCVLALRFASTDGNKAAYITLNGTSLGSDSVVGATSGSGTSIIQATGILQLATDDVLRCLGFQESGSSMDLETDFGGTYLSMAWLGETA